MIFTLIGDTHAKNDNLDKLDIVFSIAEGLAHPAIWLGDMLDTKSIVQSKCLNYYIKKFSESKLMHYVLVGNHDYHNNECLAHSLEPLKQLENVIVVDKSYFINKNLLLVPYYHDLEAFKREALSQQDINTVLVAHQGITGFDYGNGYIAENETNSEELTGFKRVLTGHFHKYQQSNNITYIGTPFSHSFGESNQTKYMATYDTTTDELSLIKTGLPQHYTHTFNCDNVDELAATKSFSANDYHRVILTGKEQNIHKFPKKLYPTVKFVEQPTLENGQSLVDETASPETIFLKWAKDIKKLDDKTINLGLTLIKENL